MVFKFRVVQPETGHRKPQRVLLIGGMTLATILLFTFLITVTAAGYIHYRLREKNRQLEATFNQLQRREKQLNETMARHHDLLDKLPTEIAPAGTRYANAEDYVLAYGRTAEMHIEAARLLSQGRWRSCLQLCDQLLGQDNLSSPTRLDVCMKAVQCRYYLGQTGRAFDQLDQVIAEWPEDRRLLHMKADMLIMSGEYESALSLLDRISQSAPPTAGMVYSMANARHGLKQFDVAIDLFRYVIANGDSPQQRAAANNLTVLYARDLSDIPRANTSLAMLLSLAPENPHALLTAGYVMLLQDRLDEAEHFLSRAEAMIPDNLDLVRDMIRLHEKAGRPDLSDQYRRRLQMLTGR